MPPVYSSADWHLPSRPHRPGWGGIVACGDDAWDALTDLVNQAVLERATLAVAGDVFDAPQVDARCLRRLRLALAPLFDVKGELVYVLGNHDARQDWLGCLAGPRSVSGTVVAVRGLAVSGCDYAEDFQPPEFLAGSAPLLGLYHQPWRDWTLRGRHALADLPAHKLAVCGDIHVAHLARPPTGPRFALSPGPLVPQALDEPPQGYGLAWRWDPDVAHPPAPEPLMRRRAYLRAPLEPGGPEAALAYACAAAAENPKRPPAVVFEAPAFPAGFHAAARAAGEKAGFLAGFRHAVPAAAAPEADIAAVRRAARADLADAVAAWPALEPEDVPVARRLADPELDPQAVIRSTRPGGKE